MSNILQNMFKSAEVESEGSEKAPLLSEILNMKNGYIPETELREILDYATNLQSVEEKSEDEKTWLVDFVSNIGMVIRAEQELDRKVAARSNPKTLVKETITLDDQKASTSRTAEEVGDSSNSKNAYESMRQQASDRDIRRPLPQLPQRTIPTIKLNELPIKPEKFDGTKSAARCWIEDFEAAAQANDWTEPVMVKYIATFLVKSARDWWTALMQPSISRLTTWSDVRNAFLRYYIGPEEHDAIREEVRRARQRMDEPATEFIARILRLMRIADPKQAEREQVHDIKIKLRGIYQDKMIGHRPQSIMELNDLCLEIEKRMELVKPREADRKNVRKPNFGKYFRPRQNERKNTPQRDGVKEDKGTNFSAGNSRDKSQIYHCTHCGKDGHTVDYCIARQRAERAEKQKKDNNVAAVANETVSEDTSNSSSDEEPPKITTLHNVCSMVAKSKEEYIYHPVKLNEVLFSAMVDTGSKWSLVHTTTVEKLKLVPKKSAVSLYGADGKQLKTRGTIRVKFWMKINNTVKLLTTKFIVVENLWVNVLLGYELLGWLEVSVNIGSRSIAFEEKKSGLRIAEECSIPPRTVAIVNATVNPKPEGNVSIITKPIDFGRSVIVANSISKISADSKIVCAIANLELEQVVVPANTQVACYEVLQEEQKDINFSESESDATERRVYLTCKLENTVETVQVGDNLSSTQIRELRTLFTKHLDAFSINGQIGKTDLVEHEIELEKNAKPVAERLRRRPLAHKVEAKKQVKKMLQEGIIEPSKSPWASAYVLVKKKNGEMRMCIDFRKLNDVTKKNQYPLPNIDDCLEMLSGNAYFSQLDLASGYWQIKMAEKAKELTAFRTEEGLFHFKRMPFGLCNAPASFQRLVNALFSGLKGVQLQVFIDDICLATGSWAEHLKLLDEVFRLLIEANLKLKPNKCTFGADRVVFLGHELSRSGIRQDPGKLKAISELPAPASAMDVRRVLGLLNYYRRFVPRFAELAAPLTKLTKKNIEFKWVMEHQEAFEAIKKALCRNPVLTHFSNKEPVTLKTDASHVGIAGILLQRHENEWKMVTCCSRQLSAAEKNYGISDLEGLAIVYSVTYFRNYLLGRHFIILTDHCALCALRKKMPNSPRLRRWAILLSEFDFSIQYVKGQLHQDVDCLSRAPVDSQVDPYLDDKVLAVMEKSSSIREEQCLLMTAIDKASWKREMDTDREAQGELAKARARTKGYKILSGMLYFEDRLFVPQGRRVDIMRESHAEDPACHGGLRATVDRMKKYWWPKMSSDVQTYIESCEVCQARKAERALPSGTMQSFSSHEPFELVAMDTVGPLPASVAGKRHVFVAIDCFTRYIDAEATEDIQGSTCGAFISSFIRRFGVPQEIISDNAPTFCNSVVKQLLERYRISHRKGTPNHHQSNAIVERAIQSLQEKLALITHDPIASTNWELELTSAVLSLNTTVHSSTKFTPFEMLFGKKHLVRSTLTIDESSAHSIYDELRERRVERMHADAIAFQSDAREAARECFDSQHRERTFEVGQLVLARVIGRRTKLQNRFMGPYIILKREKDVYLIENISERKDKLERHVCDLKPYVVRESSQSQESSNNNTTANESSSVGSVVSMTRQYRESSKKMVDWKTIMVLLLIADQQVEAFKFTPAPLIVWQPTATYVSPAPTTFKLVVRFGNSCHVLRQFRLDMRKADETELAVQNCQGVYHEQVSDRLHKLRTYLDRAPQIVGPPTNQQMLPRPGQPGTLGPQGQTHPLHQMLMQLSPSAQSQQDLVEQTKKVTSWQRGIGYSQQTNPAVTSNKIIPPKVIRDSDEQSHVLEKKQIVAALCAGAVVNNMLQTAIDRYWPNPEMVKIEDEEQSLKMKLAQLNAKVNFTDLQIRALGESQALTTQLVKHNVEMIGHVQFTYPALSLVSANLVARTHIIGATIEKIIISFRMRRPDIEALFSIFQLEALLEVDPRTINEQSIYIRSPGVDMLEIGFSARAKSNDTNVYQVKTFKYWADLIEKEAKLLEYAGLNYVLRNNKYNCIRGLSQLSGAFITAECRNKNYEDHRLSEWRMVAKGDPLQNDHQHTQIIEAWPNVYIYCYPNSINIDNATINCPSFPFQLPASKVWSTESYEYSPSAIEINMVELTGPTDIDIAKIHFKDGTRLTDSDAALKKLQGLYNNVQELENEKNVVTIMSHPITFKHTTYGLSVLMIVVVGVAVATVWQRGRQLVAELNQIRRARNDLLREQRRSLSQTYQSVHASNRPALIWHDQNRDASSELRRGMSGNTPV